MKQTIKRTVIVGDNKRQIILLINIFHTMKNFTNKLEINRLPISKMQKLEVAEFAEEVIGVVHKYNPEEMQINAMYDLLVANKPLIAQLKVHYGVDPYRLDLKPAREMMMLLVSNIKLKVRMATKTNDPKDFHVIESAINSSLRHLYRCRNAKTVTQKIRGFLNDVEADQELQAAITQFDLLEDVMQLTAAVDRVRELSRKSYKRTSSRINVSSTVHMRAVYSAVEYVFNEIEMAHLMNPELDYSPLVAELNVLVNKYRSLIVIRDHNNRRLAALKKAEEEAMNDNDANGTDGADTDDEMNNSESSTEQDSTEGETSTDEETTVEDDDEEGHESDVQTTSIEMMDIPSGETTTLESRDDSDESADQEAAASDDSDQEL